MKANEINPCGCGGRGVCYESRYYGAVYTVQCSECAIETRPYNTAEEAIKAWNTAMPKRRQRTKKTEEAAE